MRPMITSGRRAKRPDGAVYRRLRRQPVSGRTMLETTRTAGPWGGGGIWQALAQVLTFLAQRFRRRV